MNTSRGSTSRRQEASRIRRRLSGLGRTLLAFALAIGGIGVASTVTAGAAQAADHPAYPYNATFVWKLAAGSSQGGAFAGGPQSLVSYAIGETGNDTPAKPDVMEPCGTYQFDYYRITNDADQATLDMLISTRSLGPTVPHDPTNPNQDSRIGWNWSDANEGQFFGFYEGPGTPCAELETPTATQSECVNGVPSTPTLTLPANTATVTYTKSAEPAPGTTVTVTATPAEGTGFAANTAWSLHPDGTATKDFVFTTPDCGPATPVAPQVTQSVCVSGEPTTPTVTPITTTGITYTTSPVAAGTTVTITATPTLGYTLAEAAGWTAHDDGSATTTVDLTASPDCARTPVAPAVTAAVCVDGKASTPTVTPTTTAGITYRVDGTVAAGATVTVVATPDENLALATADGWTANADGTASYTVKLASVTCAPALAATGSADGTGVALGAGALLAAGLGALLYARRRQLV